MLDLGVGQDAAKESGVLLAGSQRLEGAEVGLRHRGVHAVEAQQRLFQDEEQLADAEALHRLRHCCHLVVIIVNIHSFSFELNLKLRLSNYEGILHLQKNR